MAELILGNALMLTDVARNTSVSALACWQQLTLQAAEGRSTLADLNEAAAAADACACC
jgi:hypothetical protein